MSSWLEAQADFYKVRIGAMLYGNILYIACKKGIVLL